MRLKFEKALAILLLMVSMALMPIGLVAQETEQPDTEAEDVTPPPPETPPSDTEVEEASDTIPDIFVSAIEGYGFKIHVKGISEADVVDYTWDGISITELVEKYTSTGLIEIGKDDDAKDSGFDLIIGIDDPLLLAAKPVFGIVLSSGIIFSKPLDLSDDEERAACGGICIGIVAGFVSGLALNIYQSEGATEVYGDIYAQRWECSYWRGCRWKYRKYRPTGTGHEEFRVEIIDQNFQQYVFKGRSGKTWNELTTSVTGYHFHTKLEGYCDDVWITVFAYSVREARWKSIRKRSNTWNCFPYESNDYMKIYID